MPNYNLFIRDEYRLHLDGFTVFVPNPDGTPWMLENEPIPETGLEFSLPTRNGNFSMFVRGPGHLRQPHFLNWTNWLTVSLKDDGDGDGEIILIIRDCEDIDCGPCEATKTNPGARMPTLALDEDQLRTLITNEAPTLSHDTALPVVSGPTDLECVEVKVNVVDTAGNTLTDYLCHITAHQPPGPLTLTKEIGTGVSFFIRNARETYYAIIWKAGAYTTTAKRVKFNPDAHDGVIELPHKANNDTTPLPPAVARGYVKTTPRVAHRAGSIRNSSVFSAGPGKDPNHRYNSELCRSVFDGNDRIAVAVADSSQSQAKSSRLICFYNSDIGHFTIGVGGNYWWRAWRYLDDGSRGEVIEQDIDVHYLLVEWEL